jgi:hypothetical protein
MFHSVRIKDKYIRIYEDIHVYQYMYIIKDKHLYI